MPPDDLPAGRGKKHLASANRVLLFVLGSWQMGGTFSYFQGAPLAWGNVIYLGGALDYRANDANGASFNTAAFNTVSNRQLSQNFRTFPSQFK